MAASTETVQWRARQKGLDYEHGPTFLLSSTIKLYNPILVYWADLEQYKLNSFLMFLYRCKFPKIILKRKNPRSERGKGMFCEIKVLGYN